MIYYWLSVGYPKYCLKNRGCKMEDRKAKSGSSSNLVVSFLLLMESNSVFGSVSPRL